jgi:hypothetical protein
MKNMKIKKKKNRKRYMLMIHMKNQILLIGMKVKQKMVAMIIEKWIDKLQMVITKNIMMHRKQL